MLTLKNSTDSILLTDETRKLRIIFMTESIARITYTERREFVDKPSLIVVAKTRFTGFNIREEDGDFVVTTPALILRINKKTGAIRYLDAATSALLLSEPERGGKWLTPKKVYRNVFNKDAHISTGQSIDGARATGSDYKTVFDRDAFEAKLEFTFSDGEALYGLGSHEEGYGNLRGKYRELYQQNMKAVVPYFVSTRGYGVLLDCYSLMTFRDNALGTYWWADVVDELDWYFIGAATSSSPNAFGTPQFDAVTRNYHHLTGSVPMLPKWAFGYTQSKERYVNARELADVVREYRRRKIPLDTIILDWKSWPNGSGWGQKSFDAVRFPKPQAMTKELHDMGARLMVSIWPIMTGNCENQRELLERDLMLGNQATYDAFSAEGRTVYWEQAQRGLVAQGVDGWWCDCTEPFEADWQGAVKPEPHVRLSINTEAAKKYLDHGYINAYSLLHSQGIYDGQRHANTTKRVVNLTRSSYAGQHRYGTISWNGDICATWETLRRCIPEGLNFCVTGEPYWTVDIGGFFINNDPKLWFWRGDYSDGCRGLTDMNALEPDAKDTGCRDLGFWELYTRWLQYGAFLPMFRSHGTDAAREIWRFGEAGTPFYETIAKYIKLRYQLMPYIYSQAAHVTLDSASLIRPLALDFPKDGATHAVDDQFMFGPTLMVCPVTKPMYYEKNSKPIEALTEKTRHVYLPANADWYDFWTGQKIKGGQTLAAFAPLETMPLYVKAGAIVPMTAVMQHVNENPSAPYEIRIYTGADGAFTIYEDACDSYDYEKGQYALIKLTWNDAQHELTLDARAGTFDGMILVRDYQIVVINPDFQETKTITYKGELSVINF